jgi:GTP-binding protein LepA
MVTYRLPLNEVVFDFYDRLKSISRGYASFDYEMDGFAAGQSGEGRVHPDQFRAGGRVLVHRDRGQAEARGRMICER